MLHHLAKSAKMNMCKVESAHRGCAVLRVYDRSSHPHRQLPWNALRRMRVHPFAPTPGPEQPLRFFLMLHLPPLLPPANSWVPIGLPKIKIQPAQPAEQICELPSSLATPTDFDVDASVELARAMWRAPVPLGPVKAGKLEPEPAIGTPPRARRVIKRLGAG